MKIEKILSGESRFTNWENIIFNEVHCSIFLDERFNEMGLNDHLILNTVHCNFFSTITENKLWNYYEN